MEESNNNSGDLQGNVVRQSSLRNNANLKSTSSGRVTPKNSPSFRRLHSSRTPRKEVRGYAGPIRWIRGKRLVPWLLLIALWGYVGFHVQSRWAHHENNEGFIGYGSNSEENEGDMDGEVERTEQKQWFDVRKYTNSSLGLNGRHGEWKAGEIMKAKDLKETSTSLLIKEKRSLEGRSIVPKKTRRSKQKRGIGEGRNSGLGGGVNSNNQGRNEDDTRQSDAIPRKNTSYGLIVGPFGKTEDAILGWNGLKRSGTCDRKGEFGHAVFGRSFVLIFHELSMTGAPLSMMELATEILSCGGRVSAVVLSKKGGLMGELSRRGIKVLKDKAEFSYKVAIKADLVIAGSAVCAQWIDEWWRNFGIDDLELQTLAIRILSQTCSSSGCERNWSVFERIHTKRRNRLEHKRLNDLVYTHYNLRLKERQASRKSLTDPISLENIDLTDDWVVEAEDDDAPLLDVDEIDDWMDVADAILDEGEGGVAADQYLSHFTSGSSQIIWWIMENRRAYFDRSKHVLHQVKMLIFLSDSQSKQWLAWCQEEGIKLNSQPELVALSVNDELAFVAGIPCSLNTPSFSVEKMLEKRRLLREAVRNEMGLIDKDMLVMTLSSINPAKGQFLLLVSALLTVKHVRSAEADFGKEGLVEEGNMSLVTNDGEQFSRDLLQSFDLSESGDESFQTEKSAFTDEIDHQNSSLFNLLSSGNHAYMVDHAMNQKIRKIFSDSVGGQEHAFKVLIGSIGSKSNKVPYVRGMLRFLSQHTELSKLVLWSPATTRVAALYAAADVYVINAQGLGETFGRVTIEAMAFGLPVLGTDAGGTQEIVEHNVTGLLHPLGRRGIPVLSQNLEFLLRNPTSKEQMGIQGRSKVEKMFLKHHMFKRFAQILHKCMKIK